MKKQPTENCDPFHDVKEWQDHRYDPGYYTGGNIHPLLKAKRPNRYGYVLIPSGLTLLVIALFGRDHRLYWYPSPLQTGLALLMIIAGVRLIKRPGTRTSKPKTPPLTQD
jgi:hypothetical protein